MAQGGVYVQGSGSDATITTAGTAGQVLTSNGAASEPTFQAPAATITQAQVYARVSLRG